jgi:RND family efflux transporter MFP subunit
MVNARIATAATCIALGLGALGLALARPHADNAGAPPLAVRAVTVIADDTTPGSALRFAATIHYDREATLSFRVPGRIISLPLHPGDRIAAGTRVAAIDPTAFAAAAAMRAADAAHTARDADRLAGLVQDGATSPAAADAARDAARSSAAGLTAARYDLASTRLTVPFAALVLARNAEPGETVSPGQAVVRVADRGSAVLAIADVPADIAAHLVQGASVRVWPAGASSAISGRVWRVSGGADARSGLVAVDVRIEASPGLASGSPAAVAFAAATVSATHQRIPAEALIDADANGASVWVIDAGGRARRQRLQWFGFDDRDALVGGLPAGARVITAGAGFVGEGQQVTVIGA